MLVRIGCGRWRIIKCQTRREFKSEYLCLSLMEDWVGIGGIIRYHAGTVVDRLCGLVVGVSGCLYRGPVFDSRRYQIF
jgi:hypothetical protein